MRYDVAILGAGVLGVTTAFWLSSLSDCSIALIDKESTVAFHTSSRNTGVVHRPFYLNPEKKRTFARAAQKSYFLWSSLVKRYELPWVQVGTLEIAVKDSQVPTLSQYREWALKNGMEEKEVRVLDSAGVRDIEPMVSCAGAIYSKTDTAVDYRLFTNCIFRLAERNGVEFISNREVVNLEENADDASVFLRDRKTAAASKITCNLLINAAGGGAIDVAHKLGVARQYTDLHFRGEYWVVQDSFGQKIRRNIYSVAKHKEFPFLDPHFIVRANGRREVGPNAVLVSGPGAYKGLSSSKPELIMKLFERPNSPKLKLFTNSQFLSLAWQEWRSSISKKGMCKRVKQFIPALDSSKFQERGLAGVRSSVIDDHGFVPEAILVDGRRSLHILNYNSPGATGAPAYSAFIVKRIFQGDFVSRAESEKPALKDIGWNFETSSDL